jgi:diaminopropionate ammonia-lyase
VRLGDVPGPDPGTPAAVAAIAAEGAQVTEIIGSYDDAVRLAAKAASEPEAELVQDAGWPGYEQVPGWIVDGYSTLFAEVDEQLAAAGTATPALVVIPAGEISSSVSAWLPRAAAYPARRAGVWLPPWCGTRA